MLKFLGAALKAFFWLALVLALAGLAGLYLLERGLPEPLVRRLAEAVSSGDVLCTIQRASFSLKSGLRLHRVELAPKGVAGPAFASVEESTLLLSLRPGLTAAERVRGVTLRNVRMPALPPKRPPSEAAPETPPAAPPPPPAAPSDIPPFPLAVEGADILGLRVERLAATLARAGDTLSAADLRVQCADPALSLSLAGQVTADLARNIVSGQATGATLPATLLPLLRTVRARGAVKQVERFTQFERPAAAEAAFGVDLKTGDFALRLALEVGPCAYRGVPLTRATGVVTITETNRALFAHVDALRAENETGSITGRLLYDDVAESLEVDATSSVALDQLVNILNVLNHGQLDPVRCDTPPRVTVRGLAALDSRKSTVTNDLAGTLAFETGSLFRRPLRDVRADWAIRGFSAFVGPVSAATPGGGSLAGAVSFDFPAYAATATVFSADVTLTDLKRADLLTPGDKAEETSGLISGKVALRGPVNRAIPALHGEGRLRYRDGLINRMRLFAGFTDYLAANIPGVSSLVNQSSGSADFTIRDGVLRSDNLLVEGDIFSLSGRGTCNLDTEALDLLVRANIFKKKTIAGRITHFVTLPFTRLLLEFRVNGTLSKPTWSYANIIERITDSLSDGDGTTPAPAPAP